MIVFSTLPTPSPLFESHLKHSNLPVCVQEAIPKKCQYLRLQHLFSLYLNPFKLFSFLARQICNRQESFLLNILADKL